MFLKNLSKMLILSVFLLIPLQSCYLFCLFKADPIIEETVERFLEQGMAGMTDREEF